MTEATQNPTDTARPTRRPHALARSVEDGLELRFELPGTTRDRVELTVEDGELHLVARTALSDPEGSFRVSHREFAATDFEGRWVLPDDVDVDAATSELQHGVLTVRIPAREKARRTIEIA
ncbi:MAG: Hsp20/alpha crystallin family protein [Planctomycetota bacterium]